MFFHFYEKDFLESFNKSWDNCSLNLQNLPSLSKQNLPKNHKILATQFSYAYQFHMYYVIIVSTTVKQTTIQIKTTAKNTLSLSKQTVEVLYDRKHLQEMSCYI